MKKIITHLNPDLDAVTSVWLIKRFLPGWQGAEIGFAESTVSVEKAKEINQNPDILYVDVGRGKLDHHQTDKYLSAAKLCLNYIKPTGHLDQQTLQSLVAVVTQIDNARDLKWEEVGKERYQFYLHTLIDGLRSLAKSDQQVMEFGFRALDAVLLNLKNKIRAEEELKEGREFQTLWGKGVAVESANKHVLWRGEIQGYALVVKKDPETGGVQIYSRPDSKVDLTGAYNKFRRLDPDSDWFLHASKRLLLNQASVNPNMRPTKLSLEKIIEVLRKKGGA
ncbi:hypothetical protein COU96_01015 [Candidatus Shapirobacteria bacterium CG10_big_fil_rev_8_21_14_0_10_38_14]|uniref:ChrB C-terminal domain-containing protein n=1 Tax=Candidatus Shapirobacteria bacterium CG10_big_fil_rev_8_21_14_0_10_38_14 TaxID=1974483 RepID=A0A2M8L5Z0_9BACT|nr:MAG: hypothetical protein COU96_01015 [Candidatus Shapirobacteria bacterium CG10_big_fil_rev_8_21_14_0_10_38_14]